MKAPESRAFFFIQHLTTGMSLKNQLNQIDKNLNSRFMVSAVVMEKLTIAEFALSF